MSDEPTTGELARSLADAKADFRERCAELSARQDTMVPLQLFNAHTDTARREHDELAKDIAALAGRLDADQKQRSADRRMILMAIFTSILAPLAILFITLYVNRGAR